MALHFLFRNAAAYQPAVTLLGRTAFFKGLKVLHGGSPAAAAAPTHR